MKHLITGLIAIFLSVHLFFLPHVARADYAPPDEGAGSGEPDRTEGSGTR